MNKKLEYGYTIFIMILVLILIIINEFMEDSNNDSSEDIYPISLTGIAVVIFLLYWLTSSFVKQEIVPLTVLILFIIIMISYSIYQWDRSALTSHTECGILIPKTANFNSNPYHMYRILYGITLVILATLCLLKLDESKWNSYIYIGVFSLPIIMPLLTEIFNSVTEINVEISNDEGEKKINPESLLANFVMGDSTAEMFNEHTITTIIFYFTLMYFAVVKSIGYNTEKSNWPIYIISFFMIFFSFTMRYIFIQDCSVDEDKKNIQKIDDEQILSCMPEKYGGIQILLILCLLIIAMYNIKNNTYKIFTFIIICTAIWGLSITLITNLKNN